MTITVETTPLELEEAMGYIVGTLRRMPAHWHDRRAVLHAEPNALLDEWQGSRV